MLVHKQFIFASLVVFFGGLILATIIFLPNSFEVYADNKSEQVNAVASGSAETINEITTQTEEREAEDNAEGALSKEETEKVVSKDSTALPVPTVPFYSQFNDITSASWKKVGCGIASLAMLIEYYNPGSVVVDNLLQEGITANAYLDSAGWTYAGLIGISKKYGLNGEVHDYTNLSTEKAYEELTSELEEGPVMASVHYTFQKSNPIPHLVIINGIEDGKVYYNDPAEKTGGGSVSVAQFQSAWKKRYIEFRTS